MLEWYHWCDGSRENWGAAPVGYAFLGHVVLRFGNALIGDQWRDDDFVHAEAEEPTPLRLGDNAISDVLDRIRYAREQNFYTAKRRSDAVIAHIIEEARHGRLELHARHIKGGPISPIPASCWDVEKSRHVFKSCIMSPEQPFRTSPPKEWHHVYCTEASLAARLRALPGRTVREVSDKELTTVIIENGDATQMQLFEIVSDHFKDRPIPPSPNRIKNLDVEIRHAGKLPKRTRGRPPGT